MTVTLLVAAEPAGILDGHQEDIAAGLRECGGGDFGGVCAVGREGYGRRAAGQQPGVGQVRFSGVIVAEDRQLRSGSGDR